MERRTPPSPGLCALSSPTWSQAIPGCRSRAPELGCFSLPVCPEQQGSRAGSRARGCGQISAHARGSLPTAPHPKLCAETQTPPAHLYANTRQSTRTQPPAETIYTQTLTQPALQPWVCAQLTPEADSGFFHHHSRRSWASLCVSILKTHPVRANRKIQETIKDIGKHRDRVKEG